MTVHTVEYTDFHELDELRQKHLTASRDIAAICGLHPTETAFTVYARKFGALKRDRDSNLMRRGRWMEPSFIVAFQELYPEMPLTKCNRYYYDDELRIGATPDFFSYDASTDKTGIIETKIVAFPQFLKKWFEEFIEVEGEEDSNFDNEAPIAPIHFQIQALVQAKLAGADWAIVAPMAIDAYHANLFQCPVPLDNSAWDYVRAKVRGFWERFDAGEPPDTAKSGDEPALKALYDKEFAGQILDWSREEEICALMEIWKDNQIIVDLERAKMNYALKRIADIKADLKAKMGTAPVARLPGFEISWKSQTRKAQPETTFRVMRIKQTELR